MNNQSSRFVVIMIVSILSLQTLVLAQIRETGKFEVSGTVRTAKPGQLVIQQEDGTAITCKVQDADEEALSLDGGRFIFKMPAEISFSGTMNSNLLERGMIVRFDGRIAKSGKTKGEIQKLVIVDVPPEEFQVTSNEVPEGSTFVDCNVTGRIIRVIKQKMILEVQRSRVSRQDRVTFILAEDATFDISGNDLNRVKAGDEVVVARGVALSTGDNVISRIDLRLTAKRTAATTSYHDLLEQKYSNLSDEPREAREERSKHFVLYTDISDRNVAILLSKLETMYQLVGDYYGKRPRDVIECFVVRDLQNFDGKLPRAGLLKIAEGAGVTISQRVGNVAKSYVYSCDKQGVVQHEAVHAYCYQTFGDAGPTWYAEGMAEMGQYWKPGRIGCQHRPGRDRLSDKC